MLDLDTNLTEVSMELSVLDNGQESLYDDSGLGFTVTTTGSTYRLSLAASHTATEIRAALRSIYYQHNGNNPDTNPRTITYTLFDGTNTLTKTVPFNLTPFNNPPVLSLSNTSFTFVEGDTSAAMNTNVVISDVDSSQIVSATIAFANGTPAATESLAIDETLVSGISSSGYQSNTITLTGLGSFADYQTLLNDLRYINTDGNLGKYTRDIELTIEDDEGRTSSSQVVTLTGYGYFENIKDYADGVSTAVTPTVEHYNALLLDSFFSNELDALNTYLVGKSFTTVPELQTHLDLDADGDGLPAYLDSNDTSEFNVMSAYTLRHEDPAFVSETGELYNNTTALFKISFTADSDGQNYSFDFVMSEGGAYPRWEYHRWPDEITIAVRDYATDNNILNLEAGVWNGTAYAASPGSPYNHVIVGASNIQIDLITEWYELLEHFNDPVNNAALDADDFAAMGMTSVNTQNLDVINANLLEDYNDNITFASVTDVENRIGQYDIDQDGVSLAQDADDNNPYSDSDGDGLNDRLEQILSLDPLSADTNAFTLDADNNLSADLWDDIQDNPTARAAWLNENWYGYRQPTDLVYERQAPILLGTSETVDLSNVTADATYEFIYYVEYMHAASANLFGRFTIDGDQGFSIVKPNSTGATRPIAKVRGSGETSGNVLFSGVPHHVVMTYNASTDGYQMFVNGWLVMSNISVFTGPIDYVDAQIGMFDVMTSTLTDGTSLLNANRDAIYGVQIHHGILSQSAIRDRSDDIASQSLDLDRDLIWDAFDLDDNGDGLHDDLYDDAWSVMANYIASPANTAPDLQTYTNLGLQFVTNDNYFAINDVIAQAADNGISMTNTTEIQVVIDLADIDKDGVQLSLDDNDLDPYSDTDDDGLSDLLETALALDPIATNNNALLTQDNEPNFVLDIWTSIENNAQARAAWITERWKTTSSDPSRIAIHEHLINDYNSLPTIDLSAITADATYEFIVYIDADNFKTLSLLQPVQNINAQAGFTGFNFELFDNTGFSGALVTGDTAYTAVSSPYGELAHLTFVYDATANTYTFYLNGTVLGNATNTGFSAINQTDAHLGFWQAQATNDDLNEQALLTGLIQIKTVCMPLPPTTAN